MSKRFESIHGGVCFLHVDKLTYCVLNQMLVSRDNLASVNTAYDL
jgi:hypothetical protein